LPDVAAIAAHDRQAEEGLERRGRRNRRFRPPAFRRRLFIGMKRRGRARERTAIFGALLPAPFADVEAKLRARQVAVAVVNGRGCGAVRELQPGRVGAGRSPRRVPVEGRGAHAFQEPAAEQADDVELVGALPVNDAAAKPGIEFVGTARPVDPVGEAPRVNHAQPAEVAAGDDLAHGPDGQVVAVRMPHQEHDPRSFRRGDHGLRAGQGRRHRLFGQHMLSRGAGEDHMFAVQFGRRSDVDGVEVTAREHGRQAFEPADAGLKANLAPCAVVRLRHRRKFEPVMSKHGGQKGAACRAQADEPKAESLRCGPCIHALLADGACRNMDDTVAVAQYKFADACVPGSSCAGIWERSD
jgi:hypothetical protein